MAGISTSLTFACDAPLAQSYLDVFARGDTPDFAPEIQQGWLHTSSRRDWLEAALNGVIKTYRVDGIAHLSDGFEAMSSGRLPQGQPFVARIKFDDLSRAIDGIHALFARARLDPVAFDEAIPYNWGPEATREALQCQPATLQQALSAYEEANSGNEGDTPYCLVAFLYSHAFLLEAAKLAGQEAMYVAWYY